MTKPWNVFAAMTVNARRNYFFVFYTEKNDSFWVMPSRVVKRMGYANKSGANKGKVRLDLPKQLNGVKYAKFAKYHNDAGFRLLK